MGESYVSLLFFGDSVFLSPAEKDSTISAVTSMQAGDIMALEEVKIAQSLQLETIFMLSGR